MVSDPGNRKDAFPIQEPIAERLTQRFSQETGCCCCDVSEHSHHLLCVHDLEGRFLSVNSLPARLLGYSVEEMLNMRLRDIVDPQFRDECDRLLRLLEHSGEAHGRMVVITRAGERRIWETDSVLSRDEEQAPVVCCIAHDVTDKVRSEQRLCEFERVVESLEDMIAVVDREYRYVLVNRTLLDYRGMREEQVIGRLVSEVLNPGIFETVVKEKLDECFQGKVVHYELRYKYPVMGERDLSLTYFPVEGLTGIDRVACVNKDITDWKRAEEALRESELRFRTVYERSPIGIALVDSCSGRYLQLNPKYCEIAGRTEEELLRSDVTSVTHPDDLALTGEFLRRVAEEKTGPHEMEKRYLRPDGSVRWVRVLAVPMAGKEEQQRWHMGLVEDITERKQAEEALRTSEREQYRIAEQLETERARLIEAQAVAKVGSWELELPSLEITWSEQTHRIFETDPSNFHPRRPGFVGLVHPEDRAKLDAAFEASLENGAPAKVEYRIVMGDGRVKVLEERWKVFQDGQGRPARLVGTSQDVTERKQAEEALRQSEERFRVALENSRITVFNQDLDLRYTWMYNPQFPGKDYRGKTPSEFFGGAQGEHITEIRRQVLKTGVGARHDIEIADGGKKRYYKSTIEPLFDSAGAVIGITGASADVTELRETTEALREAKKKLTEEKIYLEHEIDTELGFGEIIGRSPALQSVMENVAKVAHSDATVLLLGETGTGKELVARAIHRMSRRVDKSFIKMNCAAIPTGLLESELFGNERGAFTGAVSKKIGRLELADEGTLFLDEIGEISLDLQPKLLRVLQDQEFERLGGIHTLKVNFRLIAATNRDLAESVRENEFRSDLYYRLNVFPIRVPPLRERREDIPLLVEHFVQKCALRMNKSITSIPKKIMDMLIRWEWPGNVRELENFVERSVILTQGSVLVAPFHEFEPYAAEPKNGQPKLADESLAAAEREHILRALRESHGRIGGTRGAAMRLGLKRTTLQSKLKNLGITPQAGTA